MTISAAPLDERTRTSRGAGWIVCGAAAVLLAACAGAPAANGPSAEATASPEPRPVLTAQNEPLTPAPPKPRAQASSAVSPAAGGGDDSSLGSYLAGRHAYTARDFSSAAEYLFRALADDPENPDLLNRSASLLVADGRMEEALELAERLVRINPESRLGEVLLGLRDARNSDFESAHRRLSAMEREGVYAFLLPILDAWLTLATTDIAAAMVALEPLNERQAHLPFHAYHAGLMHLIADMPEEAESFFRRAVVVSRGSLRTVTALGAFLEGAGRPDEARTVYEEYRAQNPDSTWVEWVIEHMDAGRRPEPIARNVRHGLAEALFSAASALPQQDGGDASLIYARLALYLRPDLPIAQVLVGEILDSMGRPEDAHVAYGAVDPKSPFGWTARLRAASSLADLDRTDETIAILQAMIDERPERSDAATTLGDTMRMKERYAEAVEAYDTAITRTSDVEKRHWSLFYARGVALERTRDWPRAEEDFLRALELQPDQPLVLNYLGYSWVDQGLHLDRAREMIERAVSLRPNDGYIVDSLGWALYRLNDFAGAVRHLERAVELMSNDPVINDHLGDAFWQVGRRIEARFQWERALALDPSEEVVDAIRRKLVKGLTAEAETEGTQ